MHFFDDAHRVEEQARVEINTAMMSDVPGQVWGMATAMSLQGEGYIPKPQVMKQVLSKFKKVYLWYDNDFKHTNDNPGQDHARALIEKYPQLINICIPAEYEAKDPSDFYKFYSKEEFINLWNKLKSET